MNSAGRLANTIVWSDSSFPSTQVRSRKTPKAFEFPKESLVREACFSPAGMLPAAMLGLDCMKLLEGAVAVNDHFQDAPPRENIVMRLAAIHYLSALRGRRLRCCSAWSAALTSLGYWYDELVRSAGPIDIETEVVINPRELTRFSRILGRKERETLIHHLVVSKSRCDCDPRFVVAVDGPSNGGCTKSYGRGVDPSVDTDFAVAG